MLAVGRYLNTAERRPVRPIARIQEVLAVGARQPELHVAVAELLPDEVGEEAGPYALPEGRRPEGEQRIERAALRLPLSLFGRALARVHEQRAVVGIDRRVSTVGPICVDRALDDGIGVVAGRLAPTTHHREEHERDPDLDGLLVRERRQEDRIVADEEDDLLRQL